MRAMRGYNVSRPVHSLSEGCAMRESRLNFSFLPIAAIFLAAFAPPLVLARTSETPDARLPLRTGWQLQSSCQIGAAGARISTPDFQTAGWHSTTVPSTVVDALVADDTYPDPDFGMNLRKIPGVTYPIGRSEEHTSELQSQ